MDVLIIHGGAFLTKQKVSVNSIIFISIRAGILACGICLLMFLPAAMFIRTGIIEETIAPLLTAVCALAGGILSGIILGIGKKGRAAAALLSAAVITLILLILSAGIKETGQLPIQGILPFSGAFAAGLVLSSFMQNNKKDSRRK